MSYYGVSLKNNEEQQELARLICDNHTEIIICLGNAGTGKTFTSLAASLQMRFEKKYDNIIYTRTPRQLGDSMGFLPGDTNEKFGPFMGGLYDNIESIAKKSDMHPQVNDIKNKIECVPLAFMRGRSLDNCIIIGDEAQNFDLVSLKALLTRMGQYSKIILLGSLNQIDDPAQRRKEKCDFEQVIESIQDLPYVAVVELTKSMRSPHCAEIDERLNSIK